MKSDVLDFAVKISRLYMIIHVRENRMENVQNCRRQKYNTIVRHDF